MLNVTDREPWNKLRANLFNARNTMQMRACGLCVCVCVCFCVCVRERKIEKDREREKVIERKKERKERK